MEIVIDSSSLVVSTSHFNAYIWRIVIACTAIIDALEYVDFEAKKSPAYVIKYSTVQ